MGADNLALALLSLLFATHTLVANILRLYAWEGANQSARNSPPSKFRTSSTDFYYPNPSAGRSCGHWRHTP